MHCTVISFFIGGNPATQTEEDHRAETFTSSNEKQQQQQQQQPTDDNSSSFVANYFAATVSGFITSK